jgi:hypothetical protein
MRQQYKRGGLASFDVGGAVEDENEDNEGDASVYDPDADEMQNPSGSVTASGGLAALDFPGAEEALKLMSKSSEQARQALSQAREQIMARQYNKAQLWLAASAALGAPTRAGSTAESFGAMAGALREPLAARDAFSQQKTKDVLGIDTQLAGLDERQAQAQLALAQVRAKLGVQAASASNDRIVKPDGTLGYASHAQARQPGVTAWAPPGTQVTNDLRQEGAEAKTIGEGYAKQYLDLQAASTASQRSMSKYDRYEQLVKGSKTGAFAPTLAQIASIGEAFGIKIDPKLGAKQAADALSKEMALALRNPALGEGMPGALSDQDREYLQKMVPGLSQTTEGNKLIIDTARKLAKRQMQLAKIARDYRREHGKIDEGMFDALEKYAEDNPVFKEAADPEKVLAGITDDELETAPPAGIASPSGPSAIPSIDDAAAAEPGTVSFHSLKPQK